MVDEEVSYVLRPFSVGGLWSRNLEELTQSERTEDIQI